jgi:hypothetical protein
MSQKERRRGASYGGLEEGSAKIVSRLGVRLLFPGSRVGKEQEEQCSYLEGKPRGLLRARLDQHLPPVLDLQVRMR